MIEAKALSETLDLFSLGFDDVLAKPFHVREILARSGAIRRRMKMAEQCVDISGIRIFFDGRDPIVNGDVLPLPRRERRILECLVLSRNTRVTKTQIFNRVYGIFNDEIHENVIESHISRLRKRLKQRLGTRSDRFAAVPRIPAQRFRRGGHFAIQRGRNNQSHARPRCFTRHEHHS